MKSQNRICLITPSIEAGGAERVITQLATYFSTQKKEEVHLVLLVKAERFYIVPNAVTIHEPDFNYQEYTRVVYMVKIMKYLRNTLKQIKPKVVLSFGGRYNAFVLCATIGTGIPVYISDRSKPSISYGRFLDRLNKILYKKAAGIIAQTNISRGFTYQRTAHENIRVIGNPIRAINSSSHDQKIILNVGRFIPSKQQEVLLEIFARINPKDWRLVFVGDGETLKAVQERAKQLNMEEKVTFAGRQKKVDAYYQQAAIFAFTSISEGFPNALGEAMNASLACISFDCEAGPADLIDDGINGFLIPEHDLDLYEKKLKCLMEEETLRHQFQKAAKEKMEQFSLSTIGNQYHQFIFSNRRT